MTIKLNNIFNYNNKKPDTFVIFLDENLNLKGVAQSTIKKFTSFISKIAKFEFSKDKKKKFLIFNLPDGQKLTIIRFNSKNKSLDNEIIGGDYLDFIKKNKILNKNFSYLKEGIDLTKDLVSEPGNILHPDEYIKRILKLKKNGL